MQRGSLFRNFVLWFVDSWLEGISILLFIGLIYLSCQLMQDDFTRIWGISLLCIGTLILFLISWLFFCVIETRDLLKSIEENTRGGIKFKDAAEKENPVTAAEQQKDILAYDEKYCPNCNAKIKKTAKKCRFCNTWLNDDGGNE